MAIIETKNLTYTYPGASKPSIIDVSLKVEKGEFVLITGPSGCGKTTLCRCFNGLVPHFYQGELTGEISVAGEDTLKHHTYEMAKHVGLVFQNPENQLFALSVEKDVAFGLENIGVPREEMRKKVDWALNQTGIYDLRERSPHEISGGQQQRVAIASVLAMEPEIIVLDEPTSFLDPLSAEKIFEVIYELNKKQGITVILVEHRLDLTAKYTDHLIVMDEGKVRFEGNPREILSTEETRLIGVGIPKATLLYQMLKKDGLNLSGKTPLSSEELADQLLETLKDQMIEAENVHFSYPNKVEALKGVSLTIKDGEFVAIMGQNGAGKSTFVKHFNGLLKPTVGKVRVDGVETTKTSVAALARNVGFVFQNPDHQLFSETVEDEIAFALKNFGFKPEVVEERVTWALNLLALTQYRKTSPFLLSGGERKRVALASVLAWDPQALILDEPTIGQDHEQKEILRQFIMQMQTQGKTVVIVTHDVEFVAECNPRVVLMKEGKIVAEGIGKEILTNPDVLAESSIVLPQIAQIFMKLSQLGLPKNIIDIYEAEKIILNAKETKQIK